MHYDGWILFFSRVRTKVSDAGWTKVQDEIYFELFNVRISSAKDRSACSSQKPCTCCS